MEEDPLSRRAIAAAAAIEEAKAKEKTEEGETKKPQKKLTKT